jgi:flagellar basal body-associated protein FliL
MKVIGLVLVVVVVVGGLGAALHFGLLKLPGLVGGKAHPHPLPTVQVQVPQITTNLASTNSGDFAQLTMTVGVAGPTVAKTFATEMPAVENAVIGDIRALTLAQLNAQGGMQALQSAIQGSMDQVLGSKTAVREVYFTQFIVQ